MKLCLIVLGIVLALCALWLFLVAPNLPRRDISKLTGYDYAHRGLWNAERPENSMAAFAAAVAAGFGIETDVHITKDDQLVLFHDDSLERMCGVQRNISDCTLAELQALTLLNSQEHIPTFDEFLTLINGQVPLIIELKSDTRINELSALVYERLKAYEGVYCIESFDPRAVRWFKKNAPEVIRGQLAFGLQGANYSKTKLTNIFLASMLQNVLGRPDFIAFDARTDQSASYRLMTAIYHPTCVAWTVRSQAQMDELRARYDLQIFEQFVPRKD